MTNGPQCHYNWYGSDKRTSMLGWCTRTVPKNAQMSDFYLRKTFLKPFGNPPIVAEMKRSHRVDGPSIFWFCLTRKTRRDRWSPVLRCLWYFDRIWQDFHWFWSRFCSFWYILDHFWSSKKGILQTVQFYSYRFGTFRYLIRSWGFRKILSLLFRGMQKCHRKFLTSIFCYTMKDLRYYPPKSMKKLWKSIKTWFLDPNISGSS